MTKTHHLTANDNVPHAVQVRFVPAGTNVHVLGITGAASYIDDTMSLTEARALYRDMLDRGWAPVVKQTPRTDRQLRVEMRG